MVYMSDWIVPGIKCQASVHLALIGVTDKTSSDLQKIQHMIKKRSDINDVL